MTDIVASPHVSIRALDESAFRVSITVVAAAKVRCRGYLNDAPAAIADLAGCGGSSQAEADMQEFNKCDNGRSVCGRLWRVGALVAWHCVQGEAAAAHQRVGGVVSCPS